MLTRLCLIALLCLPACTVISNNRVFPKLGWYWSDEAKAQRADNKARHDWSAAHPATNSPAH